MWAAARSDARRGVAERLRARQGAALMPSPQLRGRAAVGWAVRVRSAAPRAQARSAWKGFARF